MLDDVAGRVEGVSDVGHGPGGGKEGTRVLEEHAEREAGGEGLILEERVEEIRAVHRGVIGA